MVFRCAIHPKAAVLLLSIRIAAELSESINPQTMINYAVNEQSTVTIKLHDVLGREVATLPHETQAAAATR